MVAPFEELADLGHDAMVILFRLIAGAGAMQRLISNSMQARSALPLMSIVQVARGKAFLMTFNVSRSAPAGV